MARPRSSTVDYFPHQCKHGKTMFIIEQKFGNDGYSVWFKLLEQLGSTEGHSINLSDPSEMEFFSAKTHLAVDKCTEIISMFAILGAIDKDLWEKSKIIWSQNFVDGLIPVYSKRYTEIPKKPILPENEIISPKTTGKPGKSLQLSAKYSIGSIVDNIDSISQSDADNKPFETEVEKIYQLYPYRDGSNNNRSTGKSSKCKLKIKSILKTGYPLAEAIKKYLDECKTKKVYLKNFSTFLNNLPDMQEPETKNPEPVKPIIDQNPWAKIRREAQQEAANATE